MQYKVLGVPTSDQRTSKAAAKNFESLLNTYGAKGYRLMDRPVNGWAVMEREGNEPDAEVVSDGAGV